MRLTGASGQCPMADAGPCCVHTYDKATGENVAAVYMPAPQTGTPMTYMVEGKQYIVVAVGGGSVPAELMAFGLP